MKEEKLTAAEATRKAIGQVWGPILATTLGLLAVFVPMAMFPGSSGAIYRQFSITLTVSIVISTVLALSLGSALCATLLKLPETAGSPTAKKTVADRLKWLHQENGRASCRERVCQYV